ncbi:DUF1853 family protein [Aequorivita sp. SDUM287046]|uniref:DUF1853 family protein n=1 Tax=Aequorivita aurantiaca TaxID=3053356 RepID=A0ABT8DGZ4_9FLAO|nr:DUF1853 family protein [Aequorivita aurantiaca]MDN3724661.1 DUF1853 family protein [Aequorivita aurantiaca]
MDSLESKILKTVVNAPDLRINSELYPFETFEFSNEQVNASNFTFPSNSVMGMQAEACFEAYLKQSENFELLAANLQINDGKKTLGELDYIVKDLAAKRIVHIELACKFYLYDEIENASEAEHWIGPNRKDSLFYKLEKIKTKQFPLLHEAETIKKLQQLNIEKPTVQKLCLKAFLFLPKKIKPDFLPKYIQDCIVGYYIKRQDFTVVKNARYAMPSKKEWLLPIEEITDWYGYSEIKSMLEAQLKMNKSPLIYQKTPHEIERFFVVWW